MKCTCYYQVVVCAQLVEATFCERPVVDQTAGFVDDDEREDRPGHCQ